MWRRAGCANAATTTCAALICGGEAISPRTIRGRGSSEGQRSSYSSYSHQQGDDQRHRRWLLSATGTSCLALITGAGVYYGWRRYGGFVVAHAAEAKHSPNSSKSLPIYTRDDVRNHGRDAERIWGVYDITDFVQMHPGGDKILMAAGASVDPFWDIYAQHKTDDVMEILEELRIGNLDPKEAIEEKKDSKDAFGDDPKRHPALIVNNEKPFNAETPPSLLADSFRTPNDLFFVRNHLPVPKTDVKVHRLTVEGLGTTSTVSLSVEDLKRRYAPISVTSVVQCAGNRRAEMNRFKKVQGLMWQGTAISNAKWTGARLRDILLTAGVNPNDPKIKHVHFEGADVDPTGQPYGASIPFGKAMSSEVIIAYHMNDEEIPRDHGYPLRVIVPGVVGARQVKWITVIRTSDTESPSHWQQKDYRMFPPSIGLNDPQNFATVPSIQEYPVQSAICTPSDGISVKRGEKELHVSGYAWSGGGRGIIRVEVSPDGGKTWQSAELQQDPDQNMDRMWAWTQWNTTIQLPPQLNQLQLVCKATDRAYNTQPETPSGIWNVRGLLNTAWHRVNVNIRD